MKRFISLRSLVLVGAVAAGFLTIFLLTRYMNLREMQMAAALRDKLAREGFTTLVVAERELIPGMVVTAKDMKSAPWPKKAVLQGSFHDIKELKDPHRHALQRPGGWSLGPGGDCGLRWKGLQLH